MKENKKGGVIINIASEYSVITPDNRIYSKNNYKPISYPVIKTGLLGLTKYLATYWADNKIRVNTITPGGVEDEQNETFKKQYSNRVPLGRMAHKEEMVGALIYLASDASSYVSGQNIIVDGGLDAW